MPTQKIPAEVRERFVLAQLRRFAAEGKTRRKLSGGKCLATPVLEALEDSLHAASILVAHVFAPQLKLDPDALAAALQECALTPLKQEVRRLAQELSRQQTEEAP